VSECVRERMSDGVRERERALDCACVCVLVLWRVLAE
jgi:hypothetical protein